MDCCSGHIDNNISHECIKITSFKIINGEIVLHFFHSSSSRTFGCTQPPVAVSYLKRRGSALQEEDDEKR